MHVQDNKIAIVDKDKKIIGDEFLDPIEISIGVHGKPREVFWKYEELVGFIHRS